MPDNKAPLMSRTIDVVALNERAATTSESHSFEPTETTAIDYSSVCSGSGFAARHSASICARSSFQAVALLEHLFFT
jgi:hypothetical protein